MIIKTNTKSENNVMAINSHDSFEPSLDLTYFCKSVHSKKETKITLR